MSVAVGHTPVLIDQKEIADGQHAILVRCCNDPKTDSWSTFEISADTTSADVQKELTDHQDRVSNLHAAKLNAKTVLASLILTPVVVSETLQV